MQRRLCRLQPAAYSLSAILRAWKLPAGGRLLRPSVLRECVSVLWPQTTAHAYTALNVLRDVVLQAKAAVVLRAARPPPGAVAPAVASAGAGAAAAAAGVGVAEAVRGA